MRESARPQCPNWLSANWVAWGKEYEKKRSDEKAQKEAGEIEGENKVQFHWKSFQGTRVNKLLMPILFKMTSNHCSYCDWYPMDTGTDPTIDHFKPKAEYSRLAYEWGNLYLCCRACQNKDDLNFSNLLLRPQQCERSISYISS